jgi:hypothetical protein
MSLFAPSRIDSIPNAVRKIEFGIATYGLGDLSMKESDSSRFTILLTFYRDTSNLETRTGWKMIFFETFSGLDFLMAIWSR